MISAKSKYVRFRELGEWSKSVMNHLWWSCVTCNGDSVTLQEKWVSILQHASSNHAWEGNEVVHVCEHETLDDAEL